jgi:hypothetical protein
LVTSPLAVGSLRGKLDEPRRSPLARYAGTLLAGGSAEYENALAGSDRDSAFSLRRSDASRSPIPLDGYGSAFFSPL